MTAFSRVVWCKTCEVGYECGKRKPPCSCPRDACAASGAWWTPTPPFKLTQNDKRFLRGIRIQADSSGRPGIE